MGGIQQNHFLYRIIQHNTTKGYFNWDFSFWRIYNIAGHKWRFFLQRTLLYFTSKYSFNLDFLTLFLHIVSYSKSTFFLIFPTSAPLVVCHTGGLNENNLKITPGV